MSAVPLHTGSRPARPSERPRLHLVGPRRHSVAFAAFLSSICALAVFATVAINALAAGDAVAALEAEKAVEEAGSHYAELVATVARLEDPARIEQVAVEELGMIPAGRARFLVVQRPLPTDRAANPPEVMAGTHVRPQAPARLADPLKPVLSVQR